jgi:hypothetical protein
MQFGMDGSPQVKSAIKLGLVRARQTLKIPLVYLQLSYIC